MQFLDAETRRQIGFEQIWSQIKPVTPMGRTLKRAARPFLPEDYGALKLALTQVEAVSAELVRDSECINELIYLLSLIRDISDTLQRSMQGYVLDDIEFYEIKKFLLLLEKIKLELDSLGWAAVLPIDLRLDEECKEALSKGQGQAETFYIADAYDEALAQHRAERSELEGSLASYRASVAEKVKEITGRMLSMDDEITISSGDLKTIARLLELASLRLVEETSQFVKFALLEDETAAQLKQRLATLRELEEQRKMKVRQWLTDIVRTHAPSMLRILGQLGVLDFLLAKARFGAQIHGVKPLLSKEPILHIEGGRHLIIEQQVVGSGYEYTPLSIKLKPGVTIITGPNMGGKTVTLKTIGLLTAMAQFGLLVPAVSMRLSPKKFIASHLTVSAGERGLSAFASEVVFLRTVLAASYQDALILVDEIAHGTNPEEGAGLAQALIEKLQTQAATTVLTTHFPALARLDSVTQLRVKGLNHHLLQENRDVVADGQVGELRRMMDYGLEVADSRQEHSSDALIVAQALGLESSIIARAQEIQRRGNP